MHNFCPSVYNDKKGFFSLKNLQIYHHICLKDQFKLFRGEIGGYLFYFYGGYDVAVYGIDVIGEIFNIIFVIHIS